MDCVSSIIHSPQPMRVVKRMFGEDSTDQEACNKRQRLYLFLEDIPEPLTRSRSDSYLSTVLSGPNGKKSKTVLFDERPLPAVTGARSSSTSTGTPAPHSATLPSFAPPSLSNSRASESRRSSSSDELRCAHASYREDLAANRVFLVGSRQASSKILSHAHSIINRVRNSPGLSEEQADAAAVELEKLRHDGDEGSIIQTFAAHHILPPSINPNLELGVGRPFAFQALSHMENQPILATPKPDMHFAFHYNAFNDQHRIIMQDSELQTYSKPVTTGYFPYFTIEFKSTARRGSIWVAENQGATNGALCVNSIERLFKIVEKSSDEVDSIAFSCLMDERAAAIWVTYCDRIKGHIINVEVEQYLMSRTTDIIGIRNAIKNICDWSLRERLPVLMSALDQFNPKYLDKDLLTRYSSVLDDQSSSSKRQDHGS